METQTPYHFYCNTQFTPEKRLAETKSTDHFIVEDLLDFSNQDDDINTPPDATTFDSITGNSTDSSNLTVVDTCNSTFSGSDPHFTAGDLGGAFHDSHLSAGELCIPYDDLAELEWLSNLVEETFSSDDLQKLQLISGMKSSAAARETSEAPEMQQEVTRSSPIFRQEVTVPGKARSKRNRAVPCNWSSRLLVLSPTTSSSESDVPSNSSGKSMTKPTKSAPKKKELVENSDGRKCLHCATDKTPQWRTGPGGPKTLCNACGVRYKSGRLVPEYRPAASPTFMLTKHSNSHRKVMELRRQKEMQMSQHQQFLYPNALYAVSGGSGGGGGGGGGCEEYLIHHQTGPDFRQLI